jgi:hypothetical protein
MTWLLLLTRPNRFACWAWQPADGSNSSPGCQDFELFAVVFVGYYLATAEQ